MNTVRNEYQQTKQDIGVNMVAYMDVDGVHVETYVQGQRVTTVLFSLQDLANNFIERRCHPETNKIDDEEGIEEAYQMMNVLMAAQDRMGASIHDPKGGFVAQ